MRSAPGDWLGEVQSSVGSTAKNHTSTTHQRNGHIPCPPRTQEALDCRPIATSGFKSKDQVAGGQIGRRIKSIGWPVGYQISIINPQPTVAVPWRPNFAAATYRDRYGHHTGRKAAHRNPHPTFTFAEQQLHIPSRPEDRESARRLSP